MDVIFAAFLALLAIYALLRMFGGARLTAQAPTTVTVDGHGVSCRYAAGEEHSIGWRELRAVYLRTTDDGPFELDVLWGLHDGSGEARVVVPQGSAGEQELLTTLQRLPGFDNEALIRAMGSTDNARFECWTGQLDGPP